MTARDVIERHLNQKAGLVLTSEANADAILAAVADAGLVIVPRTCTEKMAEAYDSIDFRRQDVACYGVLEQAKDVWNVMVEAANEQ